MTPGQNTQKADIQAIFNDLAFRYDLFNNLVSFGLDKSWRSKALQDIEKGSTLLDVGCGTGDLSLAAAQKIGSSGEVIGLDFSKEMLAVAQRRYESLGKPLNGHFELIQMGAVELPLAGKSFDWVVSGFVLRNLREHIDRVVKGIHGSLKPGGQIRLLDFTEPEGPLMAGLFRGYMNTAGTLYGRILFGKKFPAGYMAASAALFPKPDEFTEMLRLAGFVEVKAERMFFGSVVLYKGKKSV